ncbi:NAD+ synthase [Thermodesulfobacterium hydrogeniphilum]|uniref:NAD+ synthase n=1 Tax=Thermodesulfobacterium hydrogeniphilum TaxID=161156 RepID=UPI00056EE011|nr:NAD+ synthase [Thermodesulfobacterium hydrogeniphilum]
MRFLNITLAQIDPIIGDFKYNLNKILDIWKKYDENSHLVVFPEFSICGYPPEDLLLRLDFILECQKTLKELLEMSQNLNSIGVIGTPYYENDLFNALILIYKGNIIGKYYKCYLPNYSVFDEKRYFKKGNRPVLLNLNNIKIGFSICEDIWYPDGWERLYASLGAEVFISINASPYHVGKYQFKENFLKARAEDNIAYLVYINMVGAQDELVFDGRSLIIDPEGNIIARLKAFEEDIQTVSLEISKVERKRLINIRLREIQFMEDSVDIINLKNKRNILENKKGGIEKNPEFEEEIYKAIITGIRDYVYKNEFKKVVLGLSGGIDSSLVACLAVDALGKENVIGVFMPSQFTSKESKEDVEELVRNLEISFYIYSIDKIFEIFRDILNFPNFTVADENLQARIRANILFYLSNKLGALVLSTSNKSESAVGYTTIYGDMAGGFSPLKDVYKTWVYKLAQYRNSIKPDIPERVFKKPPSAELKPDQTDQDTLPPYEILDKILQLFIEEGLSEKEIIQRGFKKEIVNKVFKMIKIAEFKRKQAPIGPKITSRAFGKDWRMPITSKFF